MCFHDMFSAGGDYYDDMYDMYGYGDDYGGNYYDYYDEFGYGGGYGGARRGRAAISRPPVGERRANYLYS